jgi:hypothetical protein
MKVRNVSNVRNASGCVNVHVALIHVASEDGVVANRTDGQRRCCMRTGYEGDSEAEYGRRTHRATMEPQAVPDSESL